jgi:hypothetical protein
MSRAKRAVSFAIRLDIDGAWSRALGVISVIDVSLWLCRRSLLVDVYRRQSRANRLEIWSLLGRMVEAVHEYLAQHRRTETHDA